MKPATAKIVWALKLSLGVGLLIVLFSRVDSADLFTRLRAVHPGWLLAMFIAPHVGILLSTIKWRELLAAHGRRIPLVYLLRLYMIGTFFNSFFPTMAGGDVVRIWHLRQVEPRTDVAIASIFMERFAGVAGMVTLVPLALLQQEMMHEYWFLGYFIAAVVAGYLLLCVILFSSLPLVPSATVTRTGILRTLLDVVGRSREKIRAYRHHEGAMAWSFALSVAFYLVAGCTVYLAGRALGLNLPLATTISVTPLILLSGLIPISVNGLGVLETAYVLVLSFVGLTPAESLSLALLVRARFFFTAALGGLIFLLHRNAATNENGAGDSSAPGPGHA